MFKVTFEKPVENSEAVMCCTLDNLSASEALDAITGGIRLHGHDAVGMTLTIGNTFMAVDACGETRTAYPDGLHCRDSWAIKMLHTLLRKRLGLSLMQ